MQVTYTLSETHKAVLVALTFFDKGVSITRLQETVWRIISSDYKYLELVKMLCQGDSPVDFRKSAIEAEVVRSVSMLEPIGLLFAETRYGFREGRSNKEETTFFKLAAEGRRIADAIIEGRRTDLRPPQAARRTVFIASAFGQEELDHLFEAELRPACELAGCIPVRVDLSEPPQTISDSIIQCIRECRCVIADLTFARPSVYFEVGVAHGMGIPLILTCRKDHYRGKEDAHRVHFDLEQYKISFWFTDSHGRFCWPKRMHPEERLREVLREF